MKKIIAFFKKHYIVGNLLLIIITGCLLVALTFFGMDFYTRHGEEEEVPDLENMDEESAARLLEGRGLQCEVVDSVYRRNAGRGLIVEQYPLAGAMVKSGRKIYLTINAKGVQMVALPQTIDLSVRQARVSLESAEFNIDSVIYKPSAYKDLVLAVYCDGKEVKDGERLPINSNLVIWAGSGHEYEIPESGTQTAEDSTAIYDNADGDYYDAAVPGADEYSMEEEIIF